MTLFNTIHSLAQENIYHNIKTYPGYITIYKNMSSWGITPINIWRKSSPPTVKSPVCTATFPNRTDDMLPETGRPEKRHTIKKGTFFDLLPTDIIRIIDIWIFGTENIIKFKAAVMRINRPRNPILCVYANHIWGCNIFFSNFSHYHMIKFKYADRCYDKFGWGQHIHLIKHKHR